MTVPTYVYRNTELIVLYSCAMPFLAPVNAATLLFNFLRDYSYVCTTSQTPLPLAKKERNSYGSGLRHKKDLVRHLPRVRRLLPRLEPPGQAFSRSPEDHGAGHSA